MVAHPFLHMEVARLRNEDLLAKTARRRLAGGVAHQRLVAEPRTLEKGEDMTHRTRRIVTVAAAPVAALAAWALVRVAGIELEVSVGDGSVGPADVVLAALVGALVGWVVVRLLERHSSSPREHWSYLSSTALALSVIGPSWLADGLSAGALIAMHFLVASVVIFGFGKTLPPPPIRRAGRRVSSRSSSA